MPTAIFMGSKSLYAICYKNSSSLRSAKTAALVPRYERRIRLNLLYIILIYKFLSKV